MSVNKYIGDKTNVKNNNIVQKRKENPLYIDALIVAFEILIKSK